MGLIPDIPLPLQCSEAEGQMLVDLARRAVVAAIQGHNAPPLQESALPHTLLTPVATFVTLSLNESLRGCVGNLVAREPLYRSIMHNAVGAALHDTRFDPLTLEESTQVKIHVSVLTPLVPVSFDSVDQLLDQLIAGEDGVVLRLSGKTSTFLPQVWKTFPEKGAFLNSLCEKAGLEADAWQRPDAEVLVYRVSEFGDKSGS